MPLLENTMRRGYWECVWVPRPALSFPRLYFCYKRAHLLPFTAGDPSRCAPPAWEAHNHVAPLPLLPHESRDKGIIFGTRAVTQQMNYLSLGMEGEEAFPLGSLILFWIGGWLPGYVCVPCV